VTGRRLLLVEGWRFLPHSYALVAQSHCLCFARRDIDLRFADLPFYDPTWRRSPGILAPSEEAVLAALRPPEPSFLPQATFTLRPERPEFSPPRSGTRFAFATAEYRVLTPANVGGLRSAADVPASVHVVTPSHWAATAYARFGFLSERIHIVPHGVEPSIFGPDDAARRAMRRALGAEDSFLFASAGAMTWNKGLDLLLAAFARVAESEPRARFLLKGADALYPSRELVSEVLADLPARARAAVTSRLIYEGRTVSAKIMADLLRAADCYVSPYRAEGFNMPVLEAMACGVPIVCTQGGPTDDFTDAAFTRYVRSELRTKLLDGGQPGDALEPDLDHLVGLMLEAVHDPDAATRGALAARHARERFTWEAVSDRLLASLFS